MALMGFKSEKKQIDPFLIDVIPSLSSNSWVKHHLENNNGLETIDQNLIFKLPFYDISNLFSLRNTLSSNTDKIAWENGELVSDAFGLNVMKTLIFSPLEGIGHDLYLGKRMYIPSAHSFELEEVADYICNSVISNGLSSLSNVHITVPIEVEQNFNENKEIAKRLNQLISKKLGTSNVHVKTLEITAELLSKVIQSSKTINWQVFRDEFVKVASISNKIKLFNDDGSINPDCRLANLQKILDASDVQEFVTALFSLGQTQLFFADHLNYPNLRDAIDELRFVFVSYSYKLSFDEKTAKIVFNVDPSLKLDEHDLIALYMALENKQVRQICPDGSVKNCKFAYDKESNLLYVSEMDNKKILVANYLKKAGDVWRLEVEEEPNKWQNKLNIVRLENEQIDVTAEKLSSSEFFNDVFLLQDNSGSVSEVFESINQFLQNLKQTINIENVLNYDRNFMAGSASDKDHFSATVSGWIEKCSANPANSNDYQPIAIVFTDLGNDSSKINPNSRSVKKKWWYEGFSKNYEIINGSSIEQANQIPDELSNEWLNLMTKKISDQNGRLVVFSHGSITNANFDRRKTIRNLCQETGGVFVDLSYLGSVDYNHEAVENYVDINRKAVEKKLSEIFHQNVSISDANWKKLQSKNYLYLQSLGVKMFIEDDKISIHYSDKNVMLKIYDNYLNDMVVGIVADLAQSESSDKIQSRISDFQESLFSSGFNQPISADLAKVPSLETELENQKNEKTQSVSTGLAKVSSIEREWANSDSSSVSDLISLSKQMIDNKCNLNIINSAGLTPLIVAVYSKEESLLVSLLENGADPNAFSDSYDPLVHLVNLYEKDPVTYDRILRLLLENKYSPYNLNKSESKNPPFLLALSLGHENLVNTMLEFGQDPMIKSSEGITLVNLKHDPKYANLFDDVCNIALSEQGYWLSLQNLGNITNWAKTQHNKEKFAANLDDMLLLHRYVKSLPYTPIYSNDFAPPHIVLAQGGDCDEKCVLLANAYSQILGISVDKMHILSIKASAKSKTDSSVSEHNHAILLVQLENGRFYSLDPVFEDSVTELAPKIDTLDEAIKHLVHAYTFSSNSQAPNLQISVSITPKLVSTFALEQIFTSKTKYPPPNKK